MRQYQEATVLFRGKSRKVLYLDTYSKNKTINFGFTGFFPTSPITTKELEEVHKQLLTKLGYPATIDPVLSYPQIHPIFLLQSEDEE